MGLVAAAAVINKPAYFFCQGSRRLTAFTGCVLWARFVAKAIREGIADVRSERQRR